MKKCEGIFHLLEDGDLVRLFKVRFIDPGDNSAGPWKYQFLCPRCKKGMDDLHDIDPVSPDETITFQILDS